jgi:hypothetical protein
MSAAVQFLPSEDNEKLREDLDDLAVIAERRNEETIPHAEFKKLQPKF